MSIATKNTITNFTPPFKMNNLLNNNNNNNNLSNCNLSNCVNYTNNNLFEESELLKNLNNSVNLANTVKMNVNNNNSNCGGDGLGLLTRKVLVIYTGGTIGMMKTEGSDGLVPIPNMLEKTIRSFPNLNDQKFAETLISETEKPLVLPEMEAMPWRVTYTITEYNPLLDSTNMTMEDWIFIAKDIKANYDLYDGFVVLHGTDTMAYTASALSFMLENLNKSVVVTGSQIPLYESRSDGRENMLGALIIAGYYVVPEVTLFFGQKLYRGNRTTKVSSDRLNAFDSPNLPPLASLGINIDVNHDSIFVSPANAAPLQVYTNLSPDVALLRLYPSITIDTIKVFLQAPIRGVVLQTYGAGNFPTNRQELLDVLHDASVNRGILIVNTTQCGHGSVNAIYETGKLIEGIGVIPGFDLTTEAALTKLAYVLGRDDWDLETKRRIMKENIRGELTLPVLAAPSNGPITPTTIKPSKISESLSVTIPIEKCQLAKVSNSSANNNTSQALPKSKVGHSAIELNMHEFAHFLGTQSSNHPSSRRSFILEIAGIIFASQLLLLFCLAVVL